MSGSSAVEIDFFRLRDESSPKKLSDRRDIQGVVSKINPDLLKITIDSASANTSFMENEYFSSPLQLQTPPVTDQECGGVNMTAIVAPMSICFNGTVSVFDVTPNQAESIMKFAESLNSVSKNVVEPTLVLKVESNQNQTIGRVLRNNDMPMSRKRSLRRFLEKRKERHVSLTPYAYSEESTSSH
ncbi:hypothetical protein L1987_77094 [Smallanthus sonchifolius]|uniref:Uncharacterized protein n=1 Tax=Smallanthus sonchifolius TaxID=185202 RepID=A0ACB8Z985_9ASTR|nr:hypothetical protein L1987_77094 [Smallanthus sonchifolius]